ncbi:MAG: endonuclease [Bacteroidales bacterium]
MKRHYSTSILSICLIAKIWPAFAEIPPGYYHFATNKKNEALKSALHEITSKAKMLNYGSGEGKTWHGFYTTDYWKDEIVFDRYSAEVRKFNQFEGVDGMHIEHSFPKSWWGGYETNAYKDLFHLYPSDGLTNTTKGNLPLGEVIMPASFDNGVSKIGINSFSNALPTSCFEPADEYKGDFARSYLYIVTAYEDYAEWWNSPMLDNNTYPVWKSWAIDLLLKWHRNDPVSETEMKRQEAVFNIQGNRNPYIDYPELAEYIWGEKKTESFLFPSETKPYMITPNRWSQIDLGVLMLNDNKTQNLEIASKNLESDLNIFLKNGTVGFSLSTHKIAALEANTGTQIAVTFDASISGYSYDTICIGSSEITPNLYIPVKALITPEFILTGVSQNRATQATFNWMSVPEATGYQIDIYQGDLTAGNLILSEYIEGSGNNKAIELYNGTSRTIDLSQYSIRKQSNGNGSFSFEYMLSGTLNSGKTYFLCHPNANESLKAIADLIVLPDGGPLNFNGNDAVALYHNGIMIDLIGEKDNPVMWGDNRTLIRKKEVTHPSVSFELTNWNRHAADYTENAGIHNMQLSETSDYLCRNMNVGETTSFTYTDMSPDQQYTYCVRAQLRNGSILTANSTMQAKTTILETPEILAPSDITASSFTANWEVVPEASHYLLDLFTLSGKGTFSEEENFDTFKKGAKLPDGWSGNPSDAYTSEASSGKNPNSLKLNANEWIKTPDYPSCVSEIKFMYRFPSNGGSSYFTIEGLNGGDWLNIDTVFYQNSNKMFPIYKPEPKYKSIRIRYANRASTSLLAIDDIIVSYGSYDTTYIAKGVPAYENTYSFTELNEKTTYYYWVSSTVKNYISAPSATMQAQTASTVSTATSKEDDMIIENGTDGLVIRGIDEHTKICIYNTNGILLKDIHSFGNSAEIPFVLKGIFILQIQNNKHYKLLRLSR